MPANYTHYRFGAAMLKVMPADLARVARRHRSLYDMGLHGPDIFFYNPLLRKKYGKPAPYFHKQTGADFFGRVCRGIRTNPSEQALAYLYGVLGHYCLDSVFHPYIVKESKDGGEHLSMETEFDRYLLEQDGKIPAHTADTSTHIRLTKEECKVVAQFYPAITSSDVALCVKSMSTVVKSLAVRDGVRRTVLEKAIRAGGETASSVLMPHGPNEKYHHLNELFASFYEQAAENYPKLLLQLNAHITYNAPLGSDFAPDFG